MIPAPTGCFSSGHTWADVALAVVVLTPSAVAALNVWLGTRQHRAIAQKLPPGPG